jgi:hypothetical protein
MIGGRKVEEAAHEIDRSGIEKWDAK